MKSLLHILERGILLALVLSLDACLPIPNYAFISPAVTGKVHRNGKPVDNASVYMEHPGDENCSFKSDVVTHTDSNGEFHFDPAREFHLFVFMDPIHNWQVCIVDGDSRYQGWYQYGMGRLAGIGSPAPKVTLDCDLEQEPHAQMDRGTRTKGFCRPHWE